MRKFRVEVVLKCKRAARDPEGETIRENLLLVHGFKNVESVRTGKYLEFTVKANDVEEAMKEVYRALNELRIFNPVIHELKVSVE